MTLAQKITPEQTISSTAPADETALEDALSQPTERLCQDFTALDGDIIVLGAGGKWGRVLPAWHAVPWMPPNAGASV